MIWRPVLLLLIACAASVLATLHFGDEVVVALGLILVQAKILGQKLIAVKPQAFLAWIKHHGAGFLRKDLPYKYLSSVVLPMALGRRLLRRVTATATRLLAPVTRTQTRMRGWYGRQNGVTRLCLAATSLILTVAVTVSTVGLWLVLFSVSLPIWLAALLVTVGRLILASGQKYAFKAVAFLQLRWLWRALRTVLPQGWLRRQRRLNYRLARAVIRRRKLTARSLATRSESLSYRIGLLAEILLSRFRQ